MHGWVVVEAEQDPEEGSAAQDMRKLGYDES